MSRVDRDEDRWWLHEDPGPALVRTCERLHDEDADRRWRCSVLDRIYDGSLLTPIGDILEVEDALADGVNFTAPAIDSIRARVAATAPSIRVAGQGAGHSQMLRARDLTRYLDAQADALDAGDHASRALLQAMRLGTGVVGSSVEGDRVSLEVVPLSELHVDAADALRGRPRHMYRVRPESRERLLDLYPDCADDIEAAGERSPDALDDGLDLGVASRGPGLIEVLEGWRLPDADGEGGRHTACLRDGSILVDEDWTHPRHPFAVMYDHAPEVGFWGVGSVERAADIQHQIDELLTQLSEQLRVGTRLKIFVPRGGRVDVDQLVSSRIGAIVEYDEQMGSAPVRFQSPDPVSPELIQHLQWLIGQLYMVVGTSQEQASSMRPAGVNSGRALMYHSDLQTQRHVVLAASFRRLVRDIHEQLIDRAIDLAARGVSWPATYARGSVVRTIDWSDVDMERDEFVLQLEPTSPVPDTFAGHLEMVESMAAQGTLPPAFAARLVEDPDLPVMYRQLRADSDMAERAVEDLMDPDGPMPILRDEMDPVLTATVVRAAMVDLMSRMESGDPDALAVLDRFESYLRDIADRWAPPEASPPITTGPATGAGPGPMDAMAATAGVTPGDVQGALAAMGPPGQA